MKYVHIRVCCISFFNFHFSRLEIARAGMREMQSKTVVVLSHQKVRGGERSLMR